MEDIAEAAGVTKPVLYQHFSSKRELYRELLATVGEDVRTLIAEDAAREADPQRRVKAGFVAYFGWVREHTSAFNLLFGGSARQEDDSAEVVAAIEDQMATAVGEFIEAGVDRPHRELLGYAIVGLAEITARQWVARNGGLGAAPTTTPLDAAEGDLLAERMANLVWAGLRSLPGARAAEARLPARAEPPTEHPGPTVQIPPNCDVTLGMTCTDKSQPGVTVWEMPADDRFANPVGVLQGGFVAAFVDSAMAATSVTSNRDRRVYTANTDLRISFFRPVRTGGVLTCTARAVSTGRRVTFVEAEVVDDAGVTVARASSTFLLTDRAG